MTNFHIGDLPCVKLSNGLVVANFSSPHIFRFTTGEELAACSEERCRRGELASFENEAQSICVTAWTGPNSGTPSEWTEAISQIVRATVSWIDIELKFDLAPNKDPTKLDDGTVAYRIIDYAYSVAEAQIKLYGRSYT